MENVPLKQHEIQTKRKHLNLNEMFERNSIIYSNEFAIHSPFAIGIFQKSNLTEKLCYRFYRKDFAMKENGKTFSEYFTSYVIQVMYQIVHTKNMHSSERYIQIIKQRNKAQYKNIQRSKCEFM